MKVFKISTLSSEPKKHTHKIKIKYLGTVFSPGSDIDVSFEDDEAERIYKEYQSSLGLVLNSPISFDWIVIDIKNGQVHQPTEYKLID